MARHREKSSADHARPERKALRKTERKIEDAELPTGCGRCLRHFMPTSRNFMQQQKERHDGAGEIKDELYDIGPYHGAHTAFKRIEEREDCNDCNGDAVTGA